MTNRFMHSDWHGQDTSQKTDSNPFGAKAIHIVRRGFRTDVCTHVPPLTYSRESLAQNILDPYIV